ncbi:MAG: hypothetical protein K2Q03_00725 [Sphingobacteriaceae bacterium]|nr:hypothetical protein [Sphingobacteriaceae bacterium]
MKVIICCFLLDIGCIAPLFAQNNLGTRLLGMGNSGVAIDDVWSVKANAANITYLQSTEASINYGKYAISNELSNQAFVLAFPISSFHFGLHLEQIGITNFNEQKIGIVSAKKFGKNISIGLGFNLHQINATNYGNARGYSLDIGLSYKINSKNTIGISIQNPSKSEYQLTNINSKITSSFNIGYCYKNTDKVTLTTSINKVFKQNTDVRIGLEYRIFSIMSLRGGMSVNPYKQYFGIGVNHSKIKYDLAFSNENNLGYSPQISLGYAF